MRHQLVMKVLLRIDLYEFYLMFCNNHSIAKKSKESFGKELKKLDFQDGRESKGERRTL